MATTNVSANQTVQTFQDKNGAFHDVRDIISLSRNGALSSVSMEIDGQEVVVEINPTEAINIIELFN